VMWKDGWTPRLEAFAQAGGTVILGARTGQRDDNNHIIRDTFPGRSLSALAGVTVEEFGPLAPADRDGMFDAFAFGGASSRKREAAESGKRRYTLKLGNHEIVAGHLYELLQPAAGTETIGAWSSRFASGRAAVTSRSVGKGRVIYAGTYLTDPLVPLLFEPLFAAAGVVPLVADLPAGVEVSLRVAPGRRLLFVLNTLGETAEVRNLPAGRDLLTGSAIVDGQLALGPHGCAIIESGA
jgi:beta-galactosidase